MSDINSTKIISRSVPFEMKAQILVRFNYRCYYCGCSLAFEAAHIDHAVPRSRSGITVIENLRASCSKCNLEKGDRTEAEYLLWKAHQVTCASSIAEILARLRAANEGATGANEGAAAYSAEADAPAAKAGSSAPTQ